MPESRTSRSAVGVIPAAGWGTRLGRLPFSKELYPVDFGNRGPEGTPRPRAVCEHVLAALGTAGVRSAVVVLRQGKWDIPGYLGAGPNGAPALAYTVARHGHGVPFSVASALPFATGSTVLLGFPDIVFEPVDAAGRLLEALAGSEADVALGLFPVDEPARRDTVEVDGSNRVRSIVSKDGSSSLAHCWILAAWSPAFSDFLGRWIRDAVRGPGGPPEDAGMAAVFRSALDEGLDVRGVAIPEGRFRDIGHLDDLMTTVREGVAPGPVTETRNRPVANRGEIT